MRVFAGDYTIEKGLIEHKKFIHNICWSYYKFNKDYNIDDLENLKSSVYETLWRDKDKFKGNEGNFKNWAFVITRTIHFQMYKKQSKTLFKNIHVWDYQNSEYRDLDIIDNYTLDPVKDTDCRNLLDEIFESIKDKFPEHYFFIFYRFINGEKAIDISNDLNMKLPTVKSHIKRIKDYIIDHKYKLYTNYKYDN